MKMFSKIMLVSLLTVGCMPTTQVRANWKNAAGIVCYVFAGMAGVLTVKDCVKYFSTKKLPKEFGETILGGSLFWLLGYGLRNKV